MSRGIGAWLRTKDLSRAELELLAELFGVSVRTLRWWRSREDAERPPGRPAHTAQASASAEEEVRRVLEVEGVKQSWRGARAALQERGLKVPTRLVQRGTRAVKAARASAQARHVAEACVQVQVREAGVVWSADTTDLGRSAEGAKAEGTAVRDVASTKSVALSVGPPQTGAGLVELLRGAQLERGVTPWVLSIDNGGPQTSAELKAWALENGVILLFNQPRTPQHNPWVERGFGELKGQAGLGECEALVWPLPTRLSRAARACMPWSELVRECDARLQNARRLLDEKMRRPKLGGRTAAELDRIGESADDRNRRAHFYGDCRRAIDEALQGLEGARARRRAEREAIWCTLEAHGMVTRTQGGRPLLPSNPAGVS
jgi:transposase InsO family protein